MWLALKLLASGMLQEVLKGLLAALRWLLADWRNAVVGTVLPAFMWMALVTVPARDRTIAETEQLLTDTQLAHLGTITNFIDASAEAQRQAEANALRVAAEQEAITDATLADYRADLAALRARFDRVRARDAAGADPRRADPAGLPSAGDAAGRAAAPTGEDRLPAGHLTLADALIASEQALQLNALIDWVEKQSAVRFTPEGTRK